MVKDISISAVASANENGFSSGDINTIETTVPDGSIWYVDNAIVDENEKISASILIDDQNVIKQPNTFWNNTVSSDHQDIVYDSTNLDLFVVGSGTLYSFDVDTGEENYNFSLSGSPVKIDISPNGSKIYVLYSDSLYAYNTNDGSENFSTPLDSRDYYDLISSPDGNSVYISFWDEGADSGVLKSLNTTDGTENWSITKSPTQGGSIAVSPDSSKIYWSVAGRFDDDVYSVFVVNNDGTEQSSASLNAGKRPVSMETSSDGSELYFAYENSDNIKVFDVLNNGNTTQYRESVFVGNVTTRDMAISPNGNYLYIGGQDGSSLVDTSDLSTVWTMNNGSTSMSVAIGDSKYFDAIYSNTLRHMRPTLLSAGSRTFSNNSKVNIDNYAYGGDTIIVGVNLPNSDVGFRLCAREIVSG